MPNKGFVPALFYTFLALCLTACTSSNTASQSPTTFTGNRMTIDFKVLVGKELSDNEYREVWEIIQNTFNEVDRIYNKWNPLSEVSQLNKLKANVKTRLSPELEHLLALTDRVVRLTHGRFDPTIEPAQKLWKSKLNEGKRPTQTEVDYIKTFVGWHNIHFSKGIFYKDHDLTCMDFGGIAKGLAVDLLLQRLQNAGLEDLYVEWGGEVRASGYHPAGRPWKVLISRFGNPDPELAIAHISLLDCAIATSGDYEQFWTIETPEGKVTYFHVIDPGTCQPLIIRPNHVASATVTAETCAFADGLATAALMFDTLEAAEAWTETIIQEYPHIAFWLSTRKAFP